MARTITVNVPHALGRAEARRRVDEGFEVIEGSLTTGVRSLVTVKRQWEGDCLAVEVRALFQRTSGRIEILEDAVQMHFDVPELLAAIADRVRSRLAEQTAKLLAKESV